VHVALPCAQPGLRFGSVHAGTRPRRDGWLPAGQRRDDRDQRAARASRCGDARDITEEQVSATEDDAAIRAAHALLQEAADIGRELVSSFVSAVRTQHRQSWLAPENVPPRVVWLSDLRDGAGRRLPVGYADPMAVKIMGGMGALTASDVGNLVDQLQQGTAARRPVARRRSVHALHAAHPNPHLGLTLAAIAAEVKIKETLVILAAPEQRPVLDLVLENPRDWSMAAASLFDKALKAVAGVSLREEDKPLYKGVDDLFVHRNRFAHRGDVTLDESLVRKDLQAARRVFDWLDDKLSQLVALSLAASIPCRTCRASEGGTGCFASPPTAAAH
jgi:hypothetical protein